MKKNLITAIALFILVAVIATLINLCLSTVMNWQVFLSVSIKTIGVSAIVCLATYCLSMAIAPNATKFYLEKVEKKFENISENLLSDK